MSVNEVPLVLPRQSVKVNFEVDQGATYRLPLELRFGEVIGDALPPLMDITGMVASMQIRPCDGTADVNYSSATGTTITVDVAASIVLLHFTPADTDGFTWELADYRIEGLLTNGDVTPIIHGQLKVLSR